MNREAVLFILIGTNGVGKSFNLKKFLKVRNRNLIIPANKLDPAWDGVKELKVEHHWVTDPEDYNKKRKIKEYRVKDLKTFKGTRKIHFEIGNKSQFEDIVSHPIKGFRDGSLFIDDYRNYLESNGTIPAHFRRIFNDRRHRKLDIFMASHSLQDINAELLQFNPTIILFKTTRPPNKSVLDKIENSDELMQVYKRVNHIAKTQNKYYCEQFKPC